MAVNATAVWRVRPSGSNTNGGGYNSGISGAATDYSQQNAAQATGTHGTATGTAVFTDTVAANFTAAMVGNAIWIASGAGFTVGAYFVVSQQSTTQVTLDRSPGTGTVGVWALGGGWADPLTNPSVGSSNAVVPGNTIYILGTAAPNPASYVFDYTIGGANTVAGTTTLAITFANDPNTPGYKAPPDTTGGMPCINLTSGRFLFGAPIYMAVHGLWFVSAAADTNGAINSSNTTMLGCVYDQFGFDCGLGGTTASYLQYIGCEVFSSQGGTGGSTYAVGLNVGTAISCNIHDTVGPGITAINDLTITSNIIAKCNGGDGINISSNSNSFSVSNNTIDGNSGNGIVIDSATLWIVRSSLFNNIISNHTGVGKFGLKLTSGSAVGAGGFFDYNVFYNNTSNYSGFNAGPHDTALGVTPYVGSATQNYTLV